MSQRRARGLRWLIFAAALAGMAITFSLGRWQLARAAEKEAMHAAVAARQHLPPLGAAALAGARTPAEAAALADRTVELRGQWLPQHVIYLDNRVMERRTGFFVLTPLRLEEGAVVLVQRGWAPRNFNDRQALPPVTTPSGAVRVQGRLALHASRAFTLGAEEQGPIRQNLDLDAFRRETGLPLAPLVVVESGPLADGLLRQWAEPARGIDTHYGYAFQWFGLCALIGLLLLWFQVVRPYLHARRA